MALRSASDLGSTASRRVLIFDEPGDRFQVERCASYTTLAVATLEAASRALKTRSFDAVLCAVSRCRPDGIALPSLLLNLRRRGMLLTTPTVIWCGSADSNPLLVSHARVARAAGISVLVLPNFSTGLEIEHALHNSERQAPRDVTPLKAQPSDRDLVNALVGGDQFRIVLQPQFQLESRRIVGAEALARWHHPDMGEVPPAVFVPLAHKTGLDLLLFHLVEARVAVLLGGLAKQHSAVPISVNASATTICSAGLANRLEQRLQSAGVANSLLKIELTDDIPSQDLLALSTALCSLRMRGFQLSVGDFGFGFASFDLLTRMPFSELKVDRRFVQAMDEDSGCAAAVAASITMAKAMRLDIVAEGIETEWQIEALLRHGCQCGQGFALSAPLEVDAFTRLIVGERGSQSTSVL